MTRFKVDPESPSHFPFYSTSFSEYFLVFGSLNHLTIPNCSRAAGNEATCHKVVFVWVFRDASENPCIIQSRCF